ncbi:MAG: hypothetical protein ACLRMZ_07685 [Blautia marasmi]
MEDLYNVPMIVAICVTVMAVTGIIIFYFVSSDSKAFVGDGG